MAALSLLLLLLGVAAVLARLHGGSLIHPAAVAVVAVATTAVPVDTALDASWRLRSPLLFVPFAVPLAQALDRIGAFDALATLLARRPYVTRNLWILAAAVTALMNLEPAVVLLTPL